MNRSRPRRFIATACTLALLLLGAAGCEDGPTRVDFSNVPPPYDTSQAVETVTTPGGMKVYIIEEGSGPFKAVSRDVIDIFYTGRTQDNLEVFDSSYANGSDQPSHFQNLGPVPIRSGQRTIGTLIEGFRKGITGVKVDGEVILDGMRIGEKRTLIIPPSMGYGDADEGGTGYNLRNDTLRFDIQLDHIYN